MYPREVYVNIMASFIKYSFKYTVSLKNMDARLPGWKNVKTHYLTCLKIATIVLVIFSYTTASAAEKTTISYGVSLFGDLKYPKDFKNFAYVNPNAPKGGNVKLAAVGTFDNLNPFILK